MESGADTRANLRSAADEQVFQIPQVGDFADLGSLRVIDADLGTHVAFIVESQRPGDLSRYGVAATLVKMRVGGGD